MFPRLRSFELTRALLLVFPFMFAPACDSERTVLRPGEADAGEANDAGDGVDIGAGEGDAMNSPPEAVPEVVRLAAADLCHDVYCGSGTCVVDQEQAVCKCPPAHIQGSRGVCFACEEVKDGKVDVSLPQSVLPEVKVEINGIPVTHQMSSNQFGLDLSQDSYGIVPPGTYKIFAQNHLVGTASTVPKPAAGEPIGLPDGGVQIKVRVMLVRVEAEDPFGHRLDAKENPHRFAFFDDEGKKSDPALIGRHWVALDREVLGSFVVEAGDPLTEQAFAFKTSRRLKAKYQLTLTGLTDESVSIPTTEPQSLSKTAAGSYAGIVLAGQCSCARLLMDIAPWSLVGVAV